MIPYYMKGRKNMATFFNQATLSYSGGVVNSNITSGEIVEVLSVTKTAVGGEYILPEEVVRYEENGLRQLTDNELKVLREWVMDHTPVCAYILQNGEENFLFDLR